MSAPYKIMKRGNTRTLNKRLQNIEERLLGPKLRPVTIMLINTYSLNGNPKAIKPKLCPQRYHVSRTNPLDIRIIENYNGEPLAQNPSNKPTFQPHQDSD